MPMRFFYMPLELICSTALILDSSVWSCGARLKLGRRRYIAGIAYHVLHTILLKQRKKIFMRSAHSRLRSRSLGSAIITVIPK